MKMKEAIFTQRLRELLAELPLDADQRESVAENVASLPKGQGHALTERLSNTVSELQVTLKEVDGLMGVSEIHVNSDLTPGKALEMSTSRYHQA